MNKILMKNLYLINKLNILINKIVYGHNGKKN